MKRNKMKIWTKFKFWLKKRKARKAFVDQEVLLDLHIPAPLIRSGLDFSGVKLDGILRGYRSRKETGLTVDTAYVAGQEVFLVKEIITEGKDNVALVIEAPGYRSGDDAFDLLIRVPVIDGPPSKSPTLIAIPEIGADNKVISFNRIVFAT